MSLDRRIKLRHFTAFVETVRLGGVARAGEALGMTQPAVSKAIGELEAIVETELFDRRRRALVLTSAGEMFLRFAQSALATLRQGVDALEEARTGSSVLAFGALPTVAASIVPRAVAAFSATAFARRTLVESGPSSYLLGLLRSGGIDFVLGRLASPAAMEGLSFEHLYSEQLACVVRPDHPLAARSAVKPAEIATFQLLIPPHAAIIRPEVDALLLAGGVGTMAAPIETMSNSFGRAYTLSTDSVWIISESVVASDVAAGTLVRLPIDMSATLGPIGISTRTGADLSVPATALLDCIRTAAR